MGSWQESIPDETYALSFLSLAPAVCPLIMQSHSSIVESDFIVLGSRKITLVHEKTSPMPITCGCLIADFS